MTPCYTTSWDLTPYPESRDQFSRFLDRREHETHRFLARILPSLVTCRKHGQVTLGGLPDSLAPPGRPDRQLVGARGLGPSLSKYQSGSSRANRSSESAGRAERGFGYVSRPTLVTS